MTLLERALTYPEIGATAGQLPDGYTHVRVQRVIGHGESTFHRAADRLMSWQMHRAAGLTVVATTPRVEQDSRVRLRLGWHLLRISFGCRVVYVVEEERRSVHLPAHQSIGGAVERRLPVADDPVDPQMVVSVGQLPSGGADLRVGQQAVEQSHSAHYAKEALYIWPGYRTFPRAATLR